MSRSSKQALIQTLRGLLEETFALRSSGATHGALGRSLGYADGYMRVLLDTGVLSRQELLAVVAEERARRLGPATRTLGEGETLAA